MKTPCTSASLRREEVDEDISVDSLSPRSNRAGSELPAGYATL